MTTKFKVGDKVRFVTGNIKNQVAQDILGDYRRRTRIIIDSFYDPDHRRTYYELYGLPGFFKSYMLKLVTPRELHKRGTPRLKRKYIKHKVSHKVKPQILADRHNQNLGGRDTDK